VASTILFSPDPAQPYELGAMIQELLQRNFDWQLWAFRVDLPGTHYRALLRHAQKIQDRVEFVGQVGSTKMPAV